MTGRLDPATREALAELASCAMETAGFRGDAISTDALLRVLRKELNAGATPAGVAQMARNRDSRFIHVLHQAIAVGETFFFRQPEQFEFVSGLIQGLRPADSHGARGWSAGCATGEEAYSLAACLQYATLSSAPPLVVGTDLVERNVLVARTAIYRPWSVRQSMPFSPPVIGSAGGDLYRVVDSVKELTRFEVRNLLDPGAPDGGPFDVILCRNVLVYFTPEAAHTVSRNLVEALAPGGTILFGAADFVEPPPMLDRVGPPELQAFRRRPPVRRVAAKAASRPVRAVVSEAKSVPPPPPPARPAESRAPAEPSIAHLAALEMIERGDDARADETLRALQASAPDYIPGLLELALLCSRTGRLEAGRDLMRTVLRLTVGLAPDVFVEGPQALPAGFYVASAEAFLERAG